MDHYSEFGAMGHSVKFDYALSTAADLVMRYGPLRGMKCTVKIYDDFRDVGHCAVLTFALGAIAQHLVMCYGPLGQTNYHSAELHQFF